MIPSYLSIPGDNAYCGGNPGGFAMLLMIIFIDDATINGLFASPYISEIYRLDSHQGNCGFIF